MIGRALDREVDRDLEAVVARGGDERGEILERPELGMDRVVAAVRRADRIGAADVVRLGGQRVVGALAVGRADRVDRRENRACRSPCRGCAADDRSRPRRCRGGACRRSSSAGKVRTSSKSAPAAARRRSAAAARRSHAGGRRRGPSSRPARARAAVRRCRRGRPQHLSRVRPSRSARRAIRRSPARRRLRISASPSAWSTGCATPASSFLAKSRRKPPKRSSQPSMTNSWRPSRSSVSSPVQRSLGNCAMRIVRQSSPSTARHCSSAASCS